jgi:hypothetical protein
VTADASAWSARLHVGSSVTEELQRAGDRRFSPALLADAARHAVSAWALAVSGDDAALAAMADPQAAHWLLYPVRKRWRVAPGPLVTAIEIWGLDVAAVPPRLRVRFEFSGRRVGIDPTDGTDAAFVGLLDLAFHDTGQQRWRLSRGHVETLDGYLGYAFTSRAETAEEYRQRARTIPAAADGQRMFVVRARFAEHDIRFSSSAEVKVHGAAPPTREQAERHVWPAIEQEITRELGPGDWQPSLIWLEVVELLSEPPAS